MMNSRERLLSPQPTMTSKMAHSVAACTISGCCCCSAGVAGSDAAADVIDRDSGGGATASPPSGTPARSFPSVPAKSGSLSSVCSDLESPLSAVPCRCSPPPTRPSRRTAVPTTPSTLMLLMPSLCWPWSIYLFFFAISFLVPFSFFYLLRKKTTLAAGEVELAVVVVAEVLGDEEDEIRVVVVHGLLEVLPREPRLLRRRLALFAGRRVPAGVGATTTRE